MVRPVVALYRFSCRVDTGSVADTEGVESVRILQTDKVLNYTRVVGSRCCGHQDLSQILTRPLKDPSMLVIDSVASLYHHEP
jgi:hypothetical protein